MATKREIKLINEIMGLALKITQSKSKIAISVDYIGHCNILEVRLLDKESLAVIPSTVTDNLYWAHLSGRGPWSEVDSVTSLTRQRDNLVLVARSEGLQ